MQQQWYFIDAIIFDNSNITKTSVRLCMSVSIVIFHLSVRRNIKSRSRMLSDLAAIEVLRVALTTLDNRLKWRDTSHIYWHLRAIIMGMGQNNCWNYFCNQKWFRLQKSVSSWFGENNWFDCHIRFALTNIMNIQAWNDYLRITQLVVLGIEPTRRSIMQCGKNYHVNYYTTFAV